jgi:hypothetical protein
MEKTRETKRRGSLNEYEIIVHTSRKFTPYFLEVCPMSVKTWVLVRCTMGTFSDRRREEETGGGMSSVAALQES